MLQRIALVLTLYATVLPALGQVVSITKFRQHGKTVELTTSGVPGFTFHEFDTVLTDTAKLYLDIFANHYRDSLFSDRQYIIELTKSMTEGSLGYKRAMVVIHYLEEEYNMGAKNFRGYFLEIVTHSCSGTVGKGKR